MPRYHVTLTDEERTELQELVQKGGKGYWIKHAHILLKLDLNWMNVRKTPIGHMIVLEMLITHPVVRLQE